MVILGFKPQQLGQVAPALAPWITSKSLIVSLLAGAEVASLRRRFPHGTIVRAMPNLAVSIRRGAVALHSDGIDDPLRKQVSDLFSALGLAMWTDSEKTLGSIGSLAGSGPAYAARFIDALAAAGVRQGLPQELAATLARETVLGTAWMAASSGEPMEAIARRVASPNGTTEQGLAVLDKDRALDRLIADALEAAAERGRSLAEEARVA
jgi:pyrroline-5-carboxylate reductase